jgi:hypothetical protein
MKIKALTIRQPWANLIVLREKTIETRTWNTNHRGKIAIHVAKKVDEAAIKPYLHKMNFYRGCIIATAEIVDVKYYCNQDEFLKDTEKHLLKIEDCCLPINYGWIIENTKLLTKPIPWRGMPGLFGVEI